MEIEAFAWNSSIKLIAKNQDYGGTKTHFVLQKQIRFFPFGGTKNVMPEIATMLNFMRRKFEETRSIKH